MKEKKFCPKVVQQSVQCANMLLEGNLYTNILEQHTGVSEQTSFPIQQCSE